ncbi:MAG: tetratricopeptide repeat protein [Isosphaeraceae bacterium]|nr:tetratricopeptide repeat protein [Isosphaeraceae bacterium]
MLVGALAAIGVAGYSVKDQIPWGLRSGKDAAPAVGDATSLSAMHGRLVVRRVRSEGAADPATVLVALGRTDTVSQQELIGRADPRRLLNEIVRQAVLIAAHDHAGAITRDAMIGEEPPAGANVAEAEVAWLLTPRPIGSMLTIKPAGTKSAEPHVLKLPAADSAASPTASAYPRVLERAEVLAREELPKVFKALGVEGKPIPVKAEGGLPPGVDERLAALTFTEQFAALRAIQGALRADGESPQRLSGLIRGYAHLGVLTEFHWNPAHDVFKARALLAAQRWVAREPRSAEALRHRAYAYALAGLQRFALDDLAAAKALPTGAAPGWSPLIDAYCRYDTKTLLNTKPGPDRGLALLLAFLTVEGTWSHVLQVEVGRAMLAEYPECYRVHDGVCAAGGVSVLHEATTTPIEVYAREVPRRLQAMADLPPGIAPQLDDPANEVAAAKALIEVGRSGDRGEPSWGVLGRLMDEVRFVQVSRRAVFLAFSLGVPAGNFVKSARPLVADHPYRSLIESFGVDFARDGSRYRALLQEVKIPVVDVEVTELPFFLDMLTVADATQGQALYREAALREDTTEHDLKLFEPRVSEADKLATARYLEDVSPHSPVARAIRIEKSWAEVEGKARDWEAEDSPQVLVALGRQYIELKRWDDAQRCLKRSLTLAPDKTTYEILAHVFKIQGDWKGWQEILDQFLERGEDYGLDRATVQSEIANHLMDEGQWKDAEPYAAAAAESWSSFGMECAQRCYEGLKEWKKAELWARRNTERYPDHYWAYWYLFCKRTDQGDVDAARAFTARYIASVGQQAAGAQRIAFGCFQLMNGRKKEALAMFRDTTGDGLAAGVLFTALTADCLGDTKLRDECLERLTTDPQCTAQSKSLPIYRMYRAALAGSNTGPLDLQTVEKEISAMPEENRGNALFHVGWFLCLHGSAEKAAEYLNRCVEAKSAFFWYQFTAKDALKNPLAILGKSSS